MFYHVGRAKYINIFSELLILNFEQIPIHTLMKSDVDICIFQLKIFTHIWHCPNRLLVHYWHIRYRSPTLHIFFNVIKPTYYDHFDSQFYFYYFMPSTKMFTKRAGQMPTCLFRNEFHSTLTWILWSLLLIWSLHLQSDYFIPLWKVIKV